MMTEKENGKKQGPKDSKDPVMMTQEENQESKDRKDPVMTQKQNKVTKEVAAKI